MLAGCEEGVGFVDFAEAEDALVQERTNSALVDQAGDLSQDRSLSAASLPGEQGQNHEDQMEGEALDVHLGEVVGVLANDGDDFR